MGILYDSSGAPMAATQGGLYTSDLDASNPNSAAYRPAPSFLPGVSDVSIFQTLLATPTLKTSAVDGGAAPFSSAALQDVPPGDTRTTTDYTATSGTPDTAPSLTRLLFNTITLGYAGPTLFSCRPDSWLCAGSSGITSPNPPVGQQGQVGQGLGGTITSSLILIVAGLFIVLLIARRISP
jgi:hypothetical protein